MPNSFFQFKQFTIHQDRCAMKVSTDSCLFGAWLSKMILPNLPNIHHALDIGAGTGLLMLMIAQDNFIKIDGIEINEEACEQALSNINQSPWSHKLRLMNADVKAVDFDHTYDFIFSNPPFYENDLLPLSNSKASAMHDATLNFDCLLDLIAKNLHIDGCFALLVPYHRFSYLREISRSKGFFVKHVVHVQHQDGHDFIRSMVLLERNNTEMHTSTIKIKEKDGNYTCGFTELLKDYYLFL
jgi:tRNA1Val (adenine37-N6)-methyltransferase